MARQSLVTGASVLCYINGQLFGLVSSFKWSSNTPRRSIPEIDSLFPAELVPIMTKVTGTIGLYRKVGDQGIEGAGLSAPLDLLAQEKYFTVMLTERTTDSILFRADFCSVVNQSWDIPSRGMVMGNVSFESLSCDVNGRS